MTTLLLKIKDGLSLPARIAGRSRLTYVLPMLCVVCLFAAGECRAQKILSVHKAKKQETIFGIAKDYGVTIDELRNANPAMREPDFVLKKGMLVNIPEHLESAGTPPGAQTRTPSPQTPPATSNGMSDAAERERRLQQGHVTIGVMLPLHDINGDGLRMAEYYRGMLLAVSELKNEGYSITVNAWNVAEGDDIRKVLGDKNAAKCNVIFGPLYTAQVRGLADFCMSNNIPMVIPFSISGNDVQNCPQIYQVYQTPADLTAAAIEQFMQRFVNTYPVFIDCNDQTSKKGDFTFGLRKRLEAKGLEYSITNLNSGDEVFAKAFRTGRRNMVILNTGRSPELGQVLKKLDTLTANNPAMEISMFGYNEWFLYTQVYGEKFSQYDTYIPSTYDYDPSSIRLKRIERDYLANFGGAVQYALPCFALTGYDHAMFFIKGLKKYGKNFRGLPSEKCHTPVQTPLVFGRVGNGGYQNKAFMLVHFSGK